MKKTFELIKNLTQISPPAPIIEYIINENGDSVVDELQISKEVQEYFTKLYFDSFSTMNPDSYVYFENTNEKNQI